MYIKVEPTGCCERKGYVQARLCFYFDPEDARYNEHFVEVDEMWQNNPFHNHFIYIEPDMIDDDLMDEAEKLCKDAYKEWEKNKQPNIKNKKKPYKERTPERIAECGIKVQHLKDTPLERHLLKEVLAKAK